MEEDINTNNLQQEEPRKKRRGKREKNPKLTQENAELVLRIKEVVAWSHKNTTKFSESIGIPQSTLDGQLRETCAVSAKVVFLIIAKYPDISADWLFRGIGTMLLSDKPTTSNGYSEIKCKLLEGKVQSLQKKVARMADEVNDLTAERDQLHHELEILMQRLAI